MHPQIKVKIFLMILRTRGLNTFSVKKKLIYTKREIWLFPKPKGNLSPLLMLMIGGKKII